MKEPTFKVGDTVYIPGEDPKADTIYTIDGMSSSQVFLYHPTKPGRIISKQDIKDSPY